MKKEWFNNYIKNWSSKINWEKTEFDILSGLLMDISRKNGGEIIVDVQISEEDKQQFAVKKADEALQRKINSFVRANEPNETFKFFGEEIEDHKDNMNSFIHNLVPRIELNSAGLDELENLPGIGPVTANRIIERRESVGSYLDIEELLEIEGISKEDYYKFKNKVYIKRIDEHLAFITPELSTFLENPDFGSYVRLLIETNGSTGYDTGLDIKGKIISELKDVKHLTAQNIYQAYKNVEYIRSSQVLLQKEQEQKAIGIEQEGIDDINGTGLIFDYLYKEVITDLIKQTKKSLYIIMFFFRFEDEDKYPTDEIVNEIVAAKNRGVEIKIILDLDRKSDPYKSRKINEGIYQYLVSKDIDVVLDAPERLTHTKMFISDERYVVVGSHNLTAGSFYAYDDTSLFIDSEEYATQRIGQFKQLWQEYGLIKKYSSWLIEDVMEKPSIARELKKMRISNSMTYLVNTATPTLRKELSQKIQLDEKTILKIANICDLSRLENMPIEYATMLEEEGIDTIPELAQRNATNLSEDLEKHQSKQTGISSIPESDLISDWIEQAKTMERILEY